MSYQNNTSERPAGKLDLKVFEDLRKIAYQHAGINLKQSKNVLVNARINMRMKALGIPTPGEYLEYLKNDRSGEEVVHFLDVISTNHTSIFREKEHFRFLDRFLRNHPDKKQRTFKIWSAATSSGEEAYSIAMTAEDALKNTGRSYRILGTDISTKVLNIAKTGRYSADRLKDVEPQLLNRYFSRIGNQSEPYFSVKDFLRSRIMFKRLNLSRPPFKISGPIDIVFCRNVMIYFDNQVRQKLVTQLEKMIRPGGYLIISHTESLVGIKTQLSCVEPSIFIKQRDEYETGPS